MTGEPDPRDGEVATHEADTGRSPEYERILAENERFAEQFNRGEVGPTPLSGLAVIACMDARMQVEEILGLRTGDAHIIRNAGGLATDDAIRSLVLSQHLLGTREVVVLEHTGCALLRLPEADLRARLVAVTGRPYTMPLGTFDDLEDNVRRQVARIREHPWLLPVPVHGLVYDVATGLVREIV